MATIRLYDAQIFPTVSHPYPSIFQPFQQKTKSFAYLLQFSDTKRCLRYIAFWGNHHHFIFIGDVRIRTLYQTFVQHLQMQSGVSDADENKSSTLHYDKPIVNLEFSEPKLKLRVNYIYAPEVSKLMFDEFNKWQAQADPPSMIVTSSTQAQFLHGNITDEMLKTYSMNLSRLTAPIHTLVRNKVKVLWKLQDPVNEEKLSDEWKNVQNSVIDKYNDVVYSILKYSDAQIWSSSKYIAGGLLDDAIDGWHLSGLAAQHDIQILLNMYCNDYMNYNDGSCCSSAEPYTILQIITYAMFGVRYVLPIAKTLTKSPSILNNLSFQPLANHSHSSSTMVSTSTRCHILRPIKT